MLDSRKAPQYSWCDRGVNIPSQETGKYLATARPTAARQRQVEIGKARPEYQGYIKQVSMKERTHLHPLTPDPRARVSKRQFDRQLSRWRRQLHEYDVSTQLVAGITTATVSASPSADALGSLVMAAPAVFTHANIEFPQPPTNLWQSFDEPSHSQ